MACGGGFGHDVVGHNHVDRRAGGGSERSGRVPAARLAGYNLVLGPEAQPRVTSAPCPTITDVKVLSSPSLVVIDNQPALLEVGNQIFPSPPARRTCSPRQHGRQHDRDAQHRVILKVLPRIHANGVVQLEIEQEISNVVNPDQQTLTPTISQRRIHSTVEVTSGRPCCSEG